MAKYSDEEFGLESVVCNLTDIEFDAGYRDASWGDINGLADTFDLTGQIQSLAVVRNPEGSAKPYKLLAGRRRYYAMAKRGIQKVLVRIYPESISEDTRLLVQKIENVFRSDFAWHELVKLEKILHDGQIEKHGKKLGRTADAPGWNQAKTAELLSKNPSEISADIRLAAALQDEKLAPILQKAGGIDEARKILRHLDKNEQAKVKAAQLSKACSDLPEDQAKEQLAAAYQITDALAAMKNLPAETFDLIEVDPPYGVDLHEVKNRDNTGSMMDYNEVAAERYKEFTDTVISQAYRLLKRDGWLIYWYAMDPWHEMINRTMQKHGFRGRPVPALWGKVGPSQTIQPGIYLGRNYEAFLYYRKGDAKINKQGRGDVFTFETLNPNKKIHPTERPVALMQEVLTTFAENGSTVLVPFAGSGATLLAANNLQMNVMGFDLSQPYKDKYTVRVFEGKLHNYT